MKDEVLPGLIDPDRVPDTFAEGLASIERIGNACVRMTLYTTRDLGDGDIDRHVVARIVAPLAMLNVLVSQSKAVASGKRFMTAEPNGSVMH